MKVCYITTVLKFNRKGEKTGWTYIDVPSDVAQQLKPGNKKSFRVKGTLDSYAVKGVALLPMGDGNFIMPLNASIRKGIGKHSGAMLKVSLEEDKQPPEQDRQLLECLADEPSALNFFNSLPKSHQNYFSKWIASARTIDTKAKRLAATVNGLNQKQNYAAVIRSLKNKRVQ
jgi:hypothetical protein